VLDPQQDSEEESDMEQPWLNPRESLLDCKSGMGLWWFNDLSGEG